MSAWFDASSIDVGVCDPDLQLANLTAENFIPAIGADLLIGAALKAVLATAVRRRAATMLMISTCICQNHL